MDPLRLHVVLIKNFIRLLISGFPCHFHRERCLLDLFHLSLIYSNALKMRRRHAKTKSYYLNKNILALDDVTGFVYTHTKWRLSHNFIRNLLCPHAWTFHSTVNILQPEFVNTFSGTKLMIFYFEICLCKNKLETHRTVYHQLVRFLSITEMKGVCLSSNTVHDHHNVLAGFSHWS